MNTQARQRGLAAITRRDAANRIAAPNSPCP